MLVDSHVNLHGEKFADDCDEVVTRAVEANVSTMLNICCKVSDYEAVIAIADKYPNMWASVGTHPHDAKENPNITACLLYTSPSPRDQRGSRMPSSA